MTPDQMENRGELAAELLRNPVYADAWTEIERRIVNQLSKMDLDKDRAEHLRLCLAANRAHRKYFEAIVAMGKEGAREIERRESLADRLKKRFNEYR